MGLYRLMEQCNAATERELAERVTTRDLVRWLAWWRYKRAVEDQAIEKAKMQHG